MLSALFLSKHSSIAMQTDGVERGCNEQEQASL